MRGILFAAIIGILIVCGTAIGYGAQPITATSFPPQEVWTDYFKDIYHSTWTYDATGDDIAEIEITTLNTTTNVFKVYLADGATGSLLYNNTFTDVAYNFGANRVGITPSIYGLLHLNATSAVEYKYMAFTNASNFNRLSIYRLAYPSYANISYTHIDIPASFTGPGGLTITVNTFKYLLWIGDYNNDSKPEFVYAAVYGGTLFGITYSVLDIKMLYYNLTLAWDWNTSFILTSYGTPVSFGWIDLNGHGLNDYGGDLIITNITGTNTTLMALDVATGSELWNLTLSGNVIQSVALDGLEGTIYQFDYNNDGNIDFAISTYNTNTKQNVTYFINANGTVMGSMKTESYISKYYFAIPTMEGQPALFKNTIDINGDGFGEVFFTDNNSVIYAYDVKDNTTIWNYTLVNTSYYYTVYLSTSDISGDGIPDIFIVGGSDSTVGKNVNLTALNSSSASIIWTAYYPNLQGGISGTMVVKTISDLNGDGIQDSLILGPYGTNSNGVYTNATAISMANGAVLWTTTVQTYLVNTDYRNWSATIMFAGDMTGDSVSDVCVQLTYNNATTGYWSYLDFLSGTNGNLLWAGADTNDTAYPSVVAFAAVTANTGIDQFDFNGNGIIDDIMIITGNAVQIYSIAGIVPEFPYIGTIIMFGVIPVAALLLRKRKISAI